MPDNDLFVEGRANGVTRLLVRFDQAIDPASFSSGSVHLWGADARGRAINLGTTRISTSLANGNTVAVVTFSKKLPDVARYLVQVTGVKDLVGNALAGDNDVVFTALAGDVNGDRVVDNADAALVKGFGTVPKINPAVASQVRADVNCDGKITSTDVTKVNSLRGHDARNIAAPKLPATRSTPAGVSDPADDAEHGRHARPVVSDWAKAATALAIRVPASR
jgi:hypothetical protein